MKIGVKRAALRVSRLTSADREWILSSLPAESRVILEREIAHYCGVPSSDIADKPESLPEVKYRGSAISDGASIPGLNQLIANIDAVGAEAVYAMFVDEPDFVLALLLCAHNWKWTESVIPIFSVERRENMLSLLKGLRLPLKPQMHLLVLTVFSRHIDKVTETKANNRISVFDKIMRNIEMTESSENTVSYKPE